MEVGSDFRDKREKFRISILSTKMNSGAVWKIDVARVVQKMFMEEWDFQVDLLKKYSCF